MMEKQTDGLEVLIQDHRAVDEMFSMIERLMGEDAAQVEEIKQEVITSLMAHAQAEETCLYPIMREIVGESKTDEALVEHQEVEDILDRIQALAPEDDEFMMTFTELKDNVQHHVQEEEKELFPQLRESLDETRLAQLADEIMAVKEGIQAQV